jgi:hypothetical protein
LGADTRWYLLKDQEDGLAQMQGFLGARAGLVNGGWAAPADSTDLDVIDPPHFTALSSIFGMPAGQFGV